MALKALPTELDERMLGYLHRKELSAISKASKYYRKIAEPHLYRNIRFLADRNINARRLLLTLLLRKDLAVHIRRIEVEKDAPTSNSRQQWSEEAYKNMEQALLALLVSIASVIGSNASSAGTRMAWLGSILAEDYIEGTSVLIACLAFNLECLTFLMKARIEGPDGGSFFSKLLAEAASRSPKHDGHLSKLRKLVLQSRKYIEVPNLASLQSIKMIDCNSISCPQPQGSKPSSTKLRKIEMIHTFGLPFLSTFLHRERTPHLKTLVIHDRYSLPVTGYQQIINTLRKECPSLKYLKLTVDHHMASRGANLKGLESLESLQTLCIDLDFLLERHNQSQLLDYGAHIPPNITRLSLFNIDFADLGLLMAQSSTQAIFTPRAFFLGGPPLKKFSLNVGSTYNPSQESETMLAAFTSNLYAQGVEFQVYRSPAARSGERGVQALIKHHNIVSK